MKTYEINEAIKMLKENGELKFKITGNICTQILYVDEGSILTKCGGCSGSKSCSLRISDKWDLVQQPVSFMEAVKALNEGDTIYCQYTCDYINEKNKPFKHTYEPQSNGKIWDERNESPTLWMILNGKWYIEE